MPRSILALIICILAVIFIGSLLPNNQATLPQQAEAKLIPILAFDLQHKTHFSDADLLNGEVAIITFGQHRYMSSDYDLLTNFQELLKTDTLNDGKIDARDALYHELYLIVFANQGQRKAFVPIERAGIRVIFLYREYLDKLQINHSSLLNEEHQKVGYAVLADGSKSTIFLEKVPQSYFDNAKTNVNSR